MLGQIQLIKVSSVWNPVILKHVGGGGMMGMFRGLVIGTALTSLNIGKIVLWSYVGFCSFHFGFLFFIQQNNLSMTLLSFVVGMHSLSNIPMLNNA